MKMGLIPELWGFNAVISSIQIYQCILVKRPYGAAKHISDKILAFPSVFNKIKNNLSIRSNGSARIVQMYRQTRGRYQIYYLLASESITVQIHKFGI